MPEIPLRSLGRDVIRRAEEVSSAACMQYFYYKIVRLDVRTHARKSRHLAAQKRDHLVSRTWQLVCISDGTFRQLKYTCARGGALTEALYSLGFYNRTYHFFRNTSCVCGNCSLDMRLLEKKNNNNNKPTSVPFWLEKQNQGCFPGGPPCDGPPRQRDGRCPLLAQISRLITNINRYIAPCASGRAGRDCAEYRKGGHILKISIRLLASW